MGNLTQDKELLRTEASAQVRESTIEFFKVIFDSNEFGMRVFTEVESLLWRYEN